MCWRRCWATWMWRVAWRRRACALWLSRVSGSRAQATQQEAFVRIMGADVLSS